MWSEIASLKNKFAQPRLKTIGNRTLPELAAKGTFLTSLPHPFEFTQFHTKPKPTKKKFVSKSLAITKSAAQHKSDQRRAVSFDDGPTAAYGMFALPKMARDLNSFDKKTQWRAIHGLSEYLQNPLHAQAAIVEMDVIRLAENTYFRFKYDQCTAYTIQINRLLQIFNLLSVYLNGAQQIVRRSLLLDNLYLTVYNRDKNMEIAAKVLQNLSAKPEVLAYLVENTSAFLHLTRIYHKDICCSYYPQTLWQHLSQLLEVRPTEGVTNGFFEILLTRIQSRQKDCHQMNMKCFAQLLRCSAGQKKFDAMDGCQVLHKLLRGKTLNNYEYVVMALLNGLTSKQSQLRCREFPDMCGKLVHLASDTDNANLQLYCLKTLRLLGNVACIKNNMRIVCLRNLWNIACVNKLNECTRDELCRWLDRDMYENNGRETNNH